MAEFLFTDKFYEHLATELNLDQQDVISAVNNFFDSKVKQNVMEPVSPKKKVLPSKKQVSSNKPLSQQKKTEVVHKCERKPRNSEKTCDKAARKSIEIDGEEHWYCGTENSGCYKSALGACKRSKKTEASKTPAKSTTKSTTKPPPKSKPSTQKEAKSSADVKSKSLINSVTKMKDLKLDRVRLGDGKIVWVDHTSRIVFERTSKEAYGVMDDNNKKVLPLDDKSVRWLEASDIDIKDGAEKKLSEDDEKSGKIRTDTSNNEDLDDEDLDDEDLDDEDLDDEDLDDEDLDDEDLDDEELDDEELEDD